MQAMALSLAIILIAILSISSLSNLVISSDNTEIINSQSFGCVLAENATISYQNNVNLLFLDFISHSSQEGYYNTSIGDDSPDTVFGYYMCRADLQPETCNGCIINATEFAQNATCKHQDGIYYSDKCIFRYANYSMYGSWEKRFTYTASPIGVNVSNYKQYNQTLSSTIEALINETAYGTGFATMEANVTGDEKIYSLAQCTLDIVGVNCSSCLRLALSRLRSCCDGYQGAKISMPNCVLRYNNQSFYDTGNGMMKVNKGVGLRPAKLVVSYSALFLFMYYTYLVLDQFLA